MKKVVNLEEYRQKKSQPHLKLDGVELFTLEYSRLTGIPIEKLRGRWKI
jgi:hypothetical protein